MIDKYENEFTEELGQNMPSSRREKLEDMLETFWQWRKKGIPLMIPQICQHFEMSKRDLNYYVKKMVKLGYLVEPDGMEELRLTEFGKARGEECCFRHDALLQFLQLVGVDKEEAEEDACRMEHVVGEKTIQKICDFMQYGDTFERVLNNTNLRCQYEPGKYEFLMGIYRMEQRYPRRIADEYLDYNDRIILEVSREQSYFWLQKKTEITTKNLWYRDHMNGWIKAETAKLGEKISTHAFEFTFRPEDSIIEGIAVIAFVDEGKLPTERNCRELNVHIW